MLGTISFCLFLIVSPGLSQTEQDIPNVGPEVLDTLLQNKQYEEFARLLKIDDVKLVIPNEAERSEDPMYNKDIELGDILLGPEHKEQARQNIRFEQYGGSKWPNGYVPFSLSSNFTIEELHTIWRAIKSWNQRVECIKFIPRYDDENYVWFFKGEGCYSYLGKVNGQQPISLGNGCIYDFIIHHEMNHAIGFTHEQNRLDRDYYVDVLWDNIPQNWQSQYIITNPRDFAIQYRYDYYSIMHYRMAAPETGKDAFAIKQNGIDRTRMGGHEGFQDSDLKKIRLLYCGCCQ